MPRSRSSVPAEWRSAERLGTSSDESVAGSSMPSLSVGLGWRGVGGCEISMGGEYVGGSRSIEVDIHLSPPSSTAGPMGSVDEVEPDERRREEGPAEVYSD